MKTEQLSLFPELEAQTDSKIIEKIEPVAVRKTETEVNEQLEKFKKLVDDGMMRQKNAEIVKRYGDIVAKGTEANRKKAAAEAAKKPIEKTVRSNFGPVSYNEVIGENPDLEGLIDKPKHIKAKENQEKLMAESGSLDAISPEDFTDNQPVRKQPMNATVTGRAENTGVSVNNDIGKAKAKTAVEVTSGEKQAVKALKNAEEKAAFKGLKKVGAYAAGALALAGLTSALIGSKGQQTNDQLYGQQPLY